MRNPRAVLITLIVAVAAFTLAGVAVVARAQGHAHGAEAQPQNGPQEGMPAMCAEMMGTMQRHMAMMRRMMGDMHGAEGSAEGRMHGAEPQTSGMAGMMGMHGMMQMHDTMPVHEAMMDPESVETAAAAREHADKLAAMVQRMRDHAERMQVAVEELRARAEELEADSGQR